MPFWRRKKKPASNQSDAAVHKARPVLKNLIEGYRASALVYVAAKLGLADLLAAAPRPSAEIAGLLSADADAMQRLLRGLCVIGVCEELPDGRCGLTPAGVWLRSDTPGSLHGLAILVGEEWAPAWQGLVHSVMTGEVAFDHVFGVTSWQHRQEHPELDTYFNELMQQASAAVLRAVLAAYDFSPFQTIADLGGGDGTLLTAILQANPKATGILFDLPHVVADAAARLQAAGVADRCRIVPGSIFDAANLPTGADLYLLKSVLHDWHDAQCLEILRNCRQAAPPGSTLLIAERLLPQRALDESSTIMIDLQMLASTGGRERSRDDFAKLLKEAGFALSRILPTNSKFYLIEVKP
jgi:hypothetical protein